MGRTQKSKNLKTSHIIVNFSKIHVVSVNIIKAPACTAGSDVLRALYSELTTTLDAHVAAVNMYQRNALTLKELQSIQSLRDRPVEAAETLLNVIMEQPDAVYLCFLDVLKQTGQQHVYERLIEAGFTGRYDNLLCTPVAQSHLGLVARSGPFEFRNEPDY